MHGILRHGNSLVKIHLPHMPRVKRCEAFLSRGDIPTVIMDVPGVSIEDEGMAEEREAGDEARPEDLAQAPQRKPRARLFPTGRTKEQV